MELGAALDDVSRHRRRGDWPIELGDVDRRSRREKLRVGDSETCERLAGLMEAWNDAANSRDSYNTPSIPLFFLSFSFSLSLALLLSAVGDWYSPP